MGDKEIEITITTPSRLHFGIVDMRGDLGRIHGSVGVSIQEPRLTLKAYKSNETKIIGARSGRALDFLNKLLSINHVETSVTVEITQDIPEHAGFGSGTQLALSIGTAVSRLFDLGLQAKEIAVRLERSRVSGIGTLGFLHGGFIVDGGHAVDRRDTVAPLIHRSDVPNDWVFVVGLPDIIKGFSGEQEQNAFKKFEPPPADLVSEVSRIVMMQMIPSILEEDITLFGDAMTKLDTKFGDYWAKVQGGRYSHPRIEECVNFLLENDAYGAGQSSWGPALYGLADGMIQARKLCDELSKFLHKDDNTGKAFVTRADNKGALITDSK
ncbi:MAG: hypothetical protein NWE89_07930 [Candidatus Bathyarchaeota archaeon]|nr:hypothetical protein [Candidatus Bathyarchaeota archaeon]